MTTRGDYSLWQPADPDQARLVLDRLRRRGFRVWAAGGRVLVAPGRRLPPDLRADVVAHRAGLLALLAAPPPAPLPQPHPGADGATGGVAGPASDAAAPAGCGARQRELAARLLRWGWSAAVAEATASRIAARHADDDRRFCIECRFLRPLADGVGRCLRHRHAGLLADAVGPDFASLPQRCPGHEPAPDA